MDFMHDPLHTGRKIRTKEGIMLIAYNDTFYTFLEAVQVFEVME